MSVEYDARQLTPPPFPPGFSIGNCVASSSSADPRRCPVLGCRVQVAYETELRGVRAELAQSAEWWRARVDAVREEEEAHTEEVKRPPPQP